MAISWVNVKLLGIIDGLYTTTLMVQKSGKLPVEI